MKASRRVSSKKATWEEIRSRLAGLGQNAQGAFRVSPERAKAVLDERARVLAVAPTAQPEAKEIVELVLFSLANERYAIETAYVREVVRLTAFTHVPGSPPFLVGITNLRGEILAVVDLRKFFGVAERGLTDLSRLLVLGSERNEFGILADSVQEVLHLRKEKVLQPPESIAGIGRDYLRGVTSDALIVIDGGVLLKDSRLFIDQDENIGPA